MTDTFWFAATALIILALAFVLYPVFFHRSKAREQTDRRNQNLMAYRSRMQELDEEFAAGQIDEDNYRQLREELAGTMLDDVPETEQVRPSRSGHRSAMAVGLIAILLLPAAAFFLYERWGGMDKVEQYVTMQKMEQGAGNRAARMSELVGQLREKLEASPDNPDGWAMLGRSYMRLERYDDAAWAYRQLASVVDSDDRAQAVALGLAAQALFFGSEGKMTDEVRQVISQARSLNPDEVNSLGLLGIHAFSQKNYRKAIEFWERIEKVAPDHPQIAAIRGGVDEAYRRLGETPPKRDMAAASGAGVTVSLSLDDAFKGQVPADTTLFVFARKAGSEAGPPLAVVRLTAGALPTTVRLDDTDSMSPRMKISDADRVMVTARLSRSGSVAAQPGDWQGRIGEPVPVVADDQTPVKLVIDHQLTD